MAPHFSAPHFSTQRSAPVVPFSTNRPIGSRDFASHPRAASERPGLRSDRGFRQTQRRFANRFGAPSSGLWPDIWPDEAVAPTNPAVPPYGQPSDTGSGSEDSQHTPVAQSDMGSTVIRHDFPGYTVFDYCKVPPRDLNDCGPEWIVMHPLTGAQGTPLTPASGR
jgi:hypothetical protein